MNGKFAIHACLLGGMLLAGTATQARADAWNKKTYISTSRSIEVPGAILPPGKYVFKLVDSASNRHIVQILNERENHVYATNLAIPKQRMEPADKTIVTFYEMPGGGPEPVRSWFYPGDTIGQEFAYPKRRALDISRVTRENVPILAETRTSQPETVQPAETATRIETEAATVTPPARNDENTADRSVAAVDTPAPTPATAIDDKPAEASASMPAEEPQAAPPVTGSAAEPEMPHTAGDTAGIALLGLGCLGIAASLKMASNAAGNRS
jgi:hypothetical protein